MGALFAVIPIGFFVEPDEEELDNTRGMAKIRMFGAWITNNLVVGFSCFVLLILCMGLVMPVSEPIIHGVYKDYPADRAGISPGSIVTAINGVPVTTRADISVILNDTKPGDVLILSAEHDKNVKDYPLTLASETPDTTYYSVPFEGFWGVVHLLFWSAWINLNVGIFNAIPMIPLDGGYIFKDGVDRLLDRRGLIKYSGYVSSGVSYLMLIVLGETVALPCR